MVKKKGDSLEPFITGITSGGCEVATREQGLNLKNAQDHSLKHFRASDVHIVEAAKLKYFHRVRPMSNLCPLHLIHMLTYFHYFLLFHFHLKCGGGDENESRRQIITTVLLNMLAGFRRSTFYPLQPKRTYLIHSPKTSFKVAIQLVHVGHV